jgi:hypothetical protein
MHRDGLGDIATRDLLKILLAKAPQLQFKIWLYNSLQNLTFAAILSAKKYPKGTYTISYKAK